MISGTDKDAFVNTNAVSSWRASNIFCITRLVYNISPELGVLRTISSQLQAGKVMSETKFHPEHYCGAQRLDGVHESVWVEFIQLAQTYKPINLSQGFPDFTPPDHVTSALARASSSSDPSMNQYTRSFVSSYFIADMNSTTLRCK
jgi:hypothetical protein